MVKILILVVFGVPCSGKSTFVRALKNYLDELNTSFKNKINVNDQLVKIPRDTKINSENTSHTNKIKAAQTTSSFPFEQMVHLSYDDLMSYEINKAIIERQCCQENTVYYEEQDECDNDAKNQTSYVDKDDTNSDLV